MQKLFMRAVIQSDSELMKECLEKKIDPNFTNEDGESPLHIVATKGDMLLCQ